MESDYGLNAIKVGSFLMPIDIDGMVMATRQCDEPAYMSTDEATDKGIKIWKKNPKAGQLREGR